MSDCCDCPPDPKPVTPPPSGNTQTQTTLMGQGFDKNGQPMTRPVGVAPDGGLMLSFAGGGVTGGVELVEGDLWSFEEGRLQYTARDGALIAPIGAGLRDIEHR